MTLTAFMFPGQGSQYVGMARPLVAASPGAAELYATADAVLGVPLLDLVANGPAETLTDTRNAQPALLVTDVAWARAITEREGPPDVVLGHSLGEYAALVFAGSIAFEDALRLVRTRGELMAAAAKRVPGTMAAVLGADPARLAALLDDLRPAGVVEVTNLNCPKQVVISGELAAVEAAVARISADRLGQATRLRVSAPFHSSLMRVVADDFAAHLAAVPIAAPRLAFIDNVTGAPEADPERIRAKLVEQLFSPVLFEAAVRSAIALGASRFVEVGPGTALCGLAKRIDRGLTIVAAERLFAAPI